MKRPDLRDLPGPELPESYTIRTSREGDVEHWVRILRESFGDESFDEERFDREMRSHPSYKPERIFFVCAPNGLPCGTASAYQQPRYADDAGFLHYVGVCPAHSGKRLGTAASLAVLEKFRSEGLRCAVLQTDDFRLPAIKTYLGLDFHPVVVSKDHPERWNAVFAKLGVEAPATYEADMRHAEQ